MKNAKKWKKAQELEPLHWLENIDRIVSEKYQSKIRKRAEHIQKVASDNTGLITQNTRVLEIGCGATPLAVHWDSQQVTLADPLMNFYKKEFATIFPDGVTTIETKCEVLPFEDNYFDFVITRNTLDHVEDVDKCISEIKRVLKPNGGFYVGMNVFAGLMLFYKTIFKDPEHPYTFSEKTFTNKIKNSFNLKKCVKNDPINGEHFVENEDQRFWKKILRKLFLQLNNYAIIELYCFNKDDNKQ